MNSSSSKVDCRVLGGDKLPAATGGSDEICAAIRKAAAEQAPDRSFSVEVRVIGASILTATVTTGDGTTLPEQTMRVIDRSLSKSSFERFANALAGEVARVNHR